MKSSKLLAAMVALASLVLAGCANLMSGGSNEPIRNEVTFEGGKISVAPQIIFIPIDRKDVTIEWQLPAGRGVTFPDNGIVIEGEVIFPSETVPEAKGAQTGGLTPLRISPQRRSNLSCSRQAEGLIFRCTSNQLEEGVYKYTIRIQTREGQVFKIDPPMPIMKRPPG